MSIRGGWIFALACVLGSSGAAAQEIRYTYDADGRLISQGPAVDGLFISSTAPGYGWSGVDVSIVGNGFSDDAGGNDVTFNGIHAVVKSARSDLIVATVPAGATTGPLTVRVAGATATSPRDFVILPAGSDANGIVSSTFLPLDGSTKSVASFASRGLALSYRLASNDLASIDVSMAGCSGLTSTGLTYKLYGPASTLLVSGTLTATAPTLLSAPNAAAGTYTVILSAAQAWSCDVTGQLDPTVATGGDGLAFETTKPYQLRRVGFEMPAGGALTVATSDLNTTPANGALTIRFYGPDGTSAGAYSCGYSGYGACQGQLIYTPGGRYTAVLQPYDTRTSLVRSKFWVLPYVDGGVFTIGSSVDVKITKPGQVVRYTIPANIGDQPHLSFNNRVITGTGAWIDELTGKNPAGSCIFEGNTGCTISSNGSSVYHFAPLKYDGNYTLLYYFKSIGTGAPTGSISMTLAPTTKAQLPAASESDTAFATTLQAQNIRASMSIASGEDLSLAVTELVTSPVNQMVSVSVLNSAGVQVGSFRCGYSLDPCMTSLRSLPAGAYTVVLAPYDDRTKAFSLRLWRSPFVEGGSLAPNTTVPVIVTRPGQFVRYRIDGGVGRLLHIVTNGVAKAPNLFYMTTTVRTPGSGCYDGNASCTVSGGMSYTLYDLLPLRGSGPYEVISYMSSTGAAAPTGSGTVTFSETKVTAAPPIPGPVLVKNDIEGQNVRVPLNVVSGNDVGLGMTDLTPPSSDIIAIAGSLIKPDGTVAKTLRCGYNGSCAINTLGLAAGQYLLEFKANDDRARLFSFNLWTTNIVDGGYLAPGGSTQAAVTIAGQLIRYKVAGHAGQKLHVTLSGAVLAADAARVELSGAQADGKCALTGAGTSCIAAVSATGYDIPAPSQDGDLTFLFYVVGKGVTAPKGSVTITVSAVN